MDNSLPNLFIIGAPKCGTTALVSGLSQHNDIFVPPIKEPSYFDAHTVYDYEEDYPFKSIDTYLKLYKSKGSSNSIYRVDGSIFNMYSEISLKRILKLSPDAKFILIIRDPVNATKSMFFQRFSLKKTCSKPPDPKISRQH